MAGLGRVQQRFNTAVLGVVAALISFARGGDRQATAQMATKGHPILAKYLKSSNPNSNRRGVEYPGYCAGERETQRRWKQFHKGE